MKKEVLLEALLRELEYLNTIGIDYIEVPTAEGAKPKDRCESCATLFEPAPVRLESRTNLKVLFVVAMPEDRENLLGEKERELMAKITKAMGLKEADYQITALVRCAAAKEHFQAALVNCMDYFDEALSWANPLAIVTLGELPLKVLTGETAQPESVTGRFYSYRGIRVMPVVHPSTLLAKEELKRGCWMALKKVMALYGRH